MFLRFLREHILELSLVFMQMVLVSEKDIYNIYKSHCSTDPFLFLTDPDAFAFTDKEDRDRIYTKYIPPILFV